MAPFRKYIFKANIKTNTYLPTLFAVSKDQTSVSASKIIRSINIIIPFFYIDNFWKDCKKNW